MGRERLEIEFGRYSKWLVEAIEVLDIPDPVPAACRGTGNPLLFERAAASLALRSDDLVLDVGCGLGGPGAWLEKRFRCRVVGIDVMEESARGARRLFPDVAPTAVASSRALPFRDETFDAAWSLGVLETIDDKRGAIAETTRVLKAGGRFALYSYLAGAGLREEIPMADRLERRGTIEGLVVGAGLRIDEASSLADLAPPPAPWRESAQAVRREVEVRHSGEPAYAAVRTELDKVVRLFSSATIEPWLFSICKPGKGRS